jgi:hypothetical protein
MQTEDIEQKKLVYLYLINIAKTQPDLVIRAVNTFVRDSDDQSPLIHARKDTSPVHYRSVDMTKTRMFGRQRAYSLPSYMISSRS